MNSNVVRQQLLFWLLAVVMVAVLSMMAAHAPAVTRKLGLFSLAFGVLTGWGVSRLSQEFSSIGRQTVIIATGLLVLSGLVNVAVQSHRQLRLEQQAHQVTDPEQRLAAKLLKDSVIDDPELAARLQAQRTLSLRDYLANRISGLGAWARPFGLSLWLLELCLAAAAGVWMARRRTPPATDANAEDDVLSAPGVADLASAGQLTHGLDGETHRS